MWLAFCIHLAGCGEASLPGSGTTFDTLPSGLIQVENSASGVWRQGEGWALQETLRIGTVLGPGPDLFGRIGDLEVDEQGRIWVFEAQAEEVRVFEPGGEYVRTVGRPGEGPGEFGNVYALEWDPNGRLWVVDRGLGRISIFDTAGVFVTSRPRGNPYFAYPWPGGIDREGFFYDLESSPGPEGGDFLVRYDTLLNAVDTIPLPQHPEGPAEIQIPVTGGVATYSKPFAGTAQWALTSDGGMWVAITDQYKLLRLSPDGDTLRVATKPFEPVPVTHEEREDVLQRFRQLDADLSRLQVPDSKPAIGHLVVDDQDYVWVIPVAPAEEAGSSAEVFDTAGAFLGEVRLPLRLPISPVIIRDETLTTVTTDSLGVQYVVQFKIQKTPAG